MNAILKNKLVSALVLAFIGVGLNLVHAAVPDTINYQGYLTNASDEPIDAVQSITFKIYSTDTGGVELWTQTKNVVIQNGKFSIELGDGMEPFSSDLFDRPLYLGVAVGADAEMFPRKPLTSAPFAISAGDASTLQGETLNNIIYEDVNAIAAMGAKEAGNPLNHDRFSDANILDAIKAVDGSGSGLDADTLDGIHSSGFLTPAQGDSDYVSLRGDAITGELRVSERLGIGFTSTSIRPPTNTLHVKSPDIYPVKIDSSSSRSAILFSTGNTSLGLAGIINPNSMSFGTINGNVNGQVNLVIGGVPKLTIDQTGNTGIGTQSPASKLTVAGTIESSSGGFKFPDGSVMTSGSGDWSSITGIPPGFSDNTDDGATSFSELSGEITASQIAVASVGAAAIATGAVGISELADDSVGSSEIRDNAVGSTELAANSVGNSEIRDNGVGSSEIGDGQIATVDIADGAVTPAKINRIGLDADTLDGVSSSGFMQATIDNWVNTTGDTMTGHLVTTANIGIGNGNDPTPNYKLTVNGTQSDRLASFINDNNAAGHTYGVYTLASSSGSSSSTSASFVSQGGELNGTATGIDIIARSNGSAPSYAVYADAEVGSTTGREYAFYGLGSGYFSGKVGIGLRPPNYMLDVYESAPNSAIASINNISDVTVGDATGLHVEARGGSSSGAVRGSEHYARAYGSSNAYAIYADGIGGSTQGREYAFFGHGEGHFSDDLYVGGELGIGFEMVTGTPGDFAEYPVTLINDEWVYDSNGGHHESVLSYIAIATAACPTGKIAIGGGCDCGTFQQCALSKNMPEEGRSDVWYCSAIAGARWSSPPQFKLTAYANCARIEAPSSL